MSREVELAGSHAIVQGKLGPDMVCIAFDCRQVLVVRIQASYRHGVGRSIRLQRAMGVGRIHHDQGQVLEGEEGEVDHPGTQPEGIRTDQQGAEAGHRMGVHTQRETHHIRKETALLSCHGEVAEDIARTHRVEGRLGQDRSPHHNSPGEERRDDGDSRRTALDDVGFVRGSPGACVVDCEGLPLPLAQLRSDHVSVFAQRCPRLGRSRAVPERDMSMERWV